ncbi:triose-phosphate isomerase [candidate division KSB1 bacterium]|nr:triose-phosphate isomerase [candidate division KSB1 bacterium]
MKRKLIIAGNWKMNKTALEAEGLVKDLVSNIGSVQKTDVVICPPFTALETVGRLIDGTPIALGAQNMHWEEKGAFTGEISADMLKALGCRYVILGHSERRQYFGETDEGVNKKLRAALEAGLQPIVCVGETLKEREARVTEKVLSDQLKGVFRNFAVEELGDVILAYEPVWAIGTGRTASPQQAAQVHRFIRGILGDLFTPHWAQGLRIQYGGSVKPENIRNLLAEVNIDGALVGGASLDNGPFARIVAVAEEMSR